MIVWLLVNITTDIMTYAVRKQLHSKLCITVVKLYIQNHARMLNTFLENIQCPASVRALWDQVSVWRHNRNRTRFRRVDWALITQRKSSCCAFELEWRKKKWKWMQSPRGHKFRNGFKCIMNVSCDF